MEDEIRCLRCNSTQLSAQKRGFSGKKAVAGAILTGGIGALAGTHGANEIEIYCLNCCFHWSPAKLWEEKNLKPVIDEEAGVRDWEKRFKNAWLNGDKEIAQQTLEENYRMHEQYKTAEAYFKHLQNESARTATVVTVLIVALIIAIYFIFFN